jgi:Zn-dependent peptidase ImmA (M78 family)
LFRINPRRTERLDDIYRLDKEGKSTQEITDFMNQKYGTTLRTNRPYYSQLIWVTLDKYKKHKERLQDYEETIEEVFFEYVDIKKTTLPEEFVMNNFL